MAAVGTPSENGYAERVIRTIKEEEVYLSDYRNMADAKQQIGHFIDVVYQQKRIHSALDYMTPGGIRGGMLPKPSLGFRIFVSSFIGPLHSILVLSATVTFRIVKSISDATSDSICCGESRSRVSETETFPSLLVTAPTFESACKNEPSQML